MFTSARRAGQNVKGRVTFNPKDKARFVTNAVRAIATAKQAQAEEGEDPAVEAEKPKKFDFKQSLEAIKLQDAPEGHTDSEESQLYARVTEEPSIDYEKLAEEEAENQAHWNQLAEFLMTSKLKAMSPKEFPTELVLDSPIEIPIFKESAGVVKVTVHKRFSSRKQPHLLTLSNAEGEEVKYIFKEDDDISMDVAIMELLRLTNKVWEARQAPANIRTYNAVASVKKSGFCECIAGDTMLNVTDEDITNQLGSDPAQWERFYYSLVGIMVATAAFDITDRHDNNVLFTPDGDIALIDLSASLGNKAPMDKVLAMNPVYFPARIRKIQQHYKKISGDTPLSQKLGWKFWDEVEEDCLVSYYSLYNNYDLRHVLKQCGYRIPSPLAFHKHVDSRRHSTTQHRENIRNDIVQSMENSDVVTRVVATICRVLPAN